MLIHSMTRDNYGNSSFSQSFQLIKNQFWVKAKVDPVMMMMVLGIIFSI